MLKKNPKNRPKINVLLKHPWFNDENTKHCEVDSKLLFSRSNSLKKRNRMENIMKLYMLNFFNFDKETFEA